jgi:hypothetical protein
MAGSAAKTTSTHINEETARVAVGDMSHSTKSWRRATITTRRACATSGDGGLMDKLDAGVTIVAMRIQASRPLTESGEQSHA